MTSRWWIAAAAAAGVAVLAGGVVLLRRAAPARPAPPPVSVRSAALSPAILALAKIDPPPYVAPDERGPDSAPGFADAMRAYAAGDYAAAANGLRRVRQSGSADVPVNFFLGVSLLTSAARADAAAAIEPLTRVVSAGDSPYRQLASIYLGKALVRQGILDGAAAEWERARRLQGSHTRDAEDLLTALRAARAAR